LCKNLTGDAMTGEAVSKCFLRRLVDHVAGVDVDSIRLGSMKTCQVWLYEVE
jgi:hypothetical protein